MEQPQGEMINFGASAAYSALMALQLHLYVPNFSRSAGLCLVLMPRESLSLYCGMNSFI